MMRRARVGVAEFAIGIAERPRDVLLERRGRLERGRDLPEFEAPRRVGERLGCGAVHGAGGAKRARERYSASQQCAAIDQAITGDVIERWRAPSASYLAHDFPPWRRQCAVSQADILR